MTGVLEIPFKLIIQQMYHKIPIIGHTMFMIDELDKYIDYRINVEYQNHKMTNKELSQPLEEFVHQEKLNYMYEMLAILERDGLNHSVIVIFCANNFHSIFDGVDITHHVSLYDRFMKVPFYKCNYDDIIGYIDYYNQKLQNTIYYDATPLDMIKNSLRKDIDITHRALHKIAVQAKYKASDIIHLLNKYENEENSGESLANKINILKQQKVQTKNIIQQVNINDKQINNIQSTSEKINVNKIVNTIEPINDKQINNIDKIVNTIEPMNNVEKNIISNIMEIIDKHLGVKNEKEFYDYICYLDKNTHVVGEEYRLENYVLLEHQYTYIRDYCCKSMYLEDNSPLRTEIVNKTKLTLDNVTISPYNEKIRLTIELYDFFALKGYNLIIAYVKFKKAIIGKIELIDKYMYDQLKPETKKFLFALINLRESDVEDMSTTEYKIYMIKRVEETLLNIDYAP